MTKYIAVESFNLGTCEALGWTAATDCYVVASGDDADDVLARAIERKGMGIDVYDVTAGKLVDFNA